MRDGNDEIDETPDASVKDEEERVCDDTEIWREGMEAFSLIPSAIF